MHETMHSFKENYVNKNPSIKTISHNRRSLCIININHFLISLLTQCSLPYSLSLLSFSPNCKTKRPCAAAGEQSCVQARTVANMRAVQVSACSWRSEEAHATSAGVRASPRRGGSQHATRAQASTRQPVGERASVGGRTRRSLRRWALFLGGVTCPGL
jgi:hypothetical protein